MVRSRAIARRLEPWAARPSFETRAQESALLRMRALLAKRPTMPHVLSGSEPRSMLASILASGLAAGAIYALVGVTYNTMFSTSRVMSFTAGQLAMLGGVFGSWFMLKLGMPILVGFLLTLVGCALIGVITEFVAVRPVLKSLEQHLYVLSTLALALMIQQVAAIKWGHRTAAVPAPDRMGQRGVRRKILAAGCSLRADHRRPRIPVSPDFSRPCLPRHRRGQFRRPRARPARAQPARSPVTRWPA